MNESVYDDLALEQIAKTRFGLPIEIDHVIVRGIPVSRVATATLFLTTKKQLLLYVSGSSKLLLSDVAEKTYVSQWHLSKLLNKETGQNFSEILNGVRIDKAKLLLKDPALRIGDIAEQVGFLDITHFSRVFKKLEGISANEYRNKKE